MHSILFITVVILSVCSGLYAILVTYQLNKKYRLGYLSTYLYFQIFINVFGIYGILGQALVKRILQQQESSYQTIDLDSLLTPLGRLNKYVKKGQKILLKVNLLNASDPSKAVVTNPRLVKKTAELVLKNGGIPIIGDSPSGQFTKRRLKKVYEKGGYTAISRDLGIELNYDVTTKKIPIPHGKILKKTPISNFILQK